MRLGETSDPLLGMRPLKSAQEAKSTLREIPTKKTEDIKEPEKAGAEVLETTQQGETLQKSRVNGVRE